MNSKTLKILSHGLAMTMILGLLSGTASSVNAAPGDLTRVSVDSTGVQGNGSSRHEQISGDSRFVVFESDSTNLGGGTGGLFLKDRQTGATTRVGVDGEDAAISNDGRFIAFDSGATNEVSGDANGLFDIFVYDRQTGLTTLVSVDSSGAQANADTYGPAISGDGRYVAFPSDASNLVSDDTNGASDIFVHDLQTGTTERVSIASDGAQSNGGCSEVSISADGRVVVFTSNATNLVSGDTNGKTDIFARDRQTGTTTRVSVNSSGVEADRGANDSSVSANGRFVSFSSFSENLMSQEPLEFEHVFVHDLQTGVTTLASSYSTGYQLIGRSEQSVISADGRYVAFQFDDRGDGLPFLEIYIHDSLTGATISAPGGYHQESSFTPSISADGRYLAYWTPFALVAGDTNGTNDIFVYEPAFGPDLSPTVTEVQRLCGGGCTSYPTPALETFRVTFSEAVTGVSMDDFALTTSGSVSGASVTELTGTANVYRVTVNTGTGDGTLRLDIVDNDSILDPSLNPLGGPGAGNGSFTTAETFIVDKSAPSVNSSLRADPNPTVAGSVNFTVSFSEAVTGVDASDFALATTGSISGASLAIVSGSGNTYSVNVNTGTGDGTIRLELVDDDSILDSVMNPLGGAGAGNGDFSGGEAYTVNPNVPRVISSLRADVNPSPADSVHYTVTFSEPVSGVDASDFVLTTTEAISGAATTGISGSGNTYIVTVGTGSGDGTIRLDVIDNDSILDSEGNPLAGPGAGNGNFLTGEAYTIKKTQISRFSESFRSNGTNDGWILESSEDSNQGGSKNATAITFSLGDDSQDRQYRAILHFPTYYLPDSAVVTQVILVIKNLGLVGTNPFTTHQNINVDIRGGYFGPSGLFGLNALDLMDFQAAATKNSVGTISNNPVSGWYWTLMDASANQFINLQGVTQLRLMFQKDDNDDSGDDYLTFFSGNYDLLSDRPHLLIEYFTQR